MLREHIVGLEDSSVDPAVADEVKRTLVTMVDDLTPTQQKQLKALTACSPGVGLREYCVLLSLYQAANTVSKNPPPVHPTDPSSWEPSMLAGLYPWVSEHLGGLSRRIHGYVMLCEELRRAGSDITLVETIGTYRLPEEYEKFSAQVTDGFEMLLLWVSAQYGVSPSQVSVFALQYVTYALEGTVGSFVPVARTPFEHPLMGHSIRMFHRAHARAFMWGDPGGDVLNTFWGYLNDGGVQGFTKEYLRVRGYTCDSFREAVLSIRGVRRMVPSAVASVAAWLGVDDQSPVVDKAAVVTVACDVILASQNIVEGLCPGLWGMIEEVDNPRELLGLPGQVYMSVRNSYFTPQ